MRRLLEKFMIFMQGRYGGDTLNNFLIGLLIFVWFCNIFIFNRFVHHIVFLFELIIFAYALFRMLSCNITKRSAENRAFLKIYTPAKDWVKLTFKKIKDRKEYRYVKCPVCKAQLRVKNIKGNHIVRCPKCGSEFDKKI